MLRMEMIKFRLSKDKMRPKGIKMVSCAYQGAIL